VFAKKMDQEQTRLDFVLLFHSVDFYFDEAFHARIPIVPLQRFNFSATRSSRNRNCDRVGPPYSALG
jgi:hypothetical protein